jgi:hypothetical protein
MRHLARKTVEIVTVSAGLYRELAVSALRLIPMVRQRRSRTVYGHSVQQPA